jgi:hypothetical protein
MTTIKVRHVLKIQGGNKSSIAQRELLKTTHQQLEYFTKGSQAQFYEVFINMNRFWRMDRICPNRQGPEVMEAKIKLEE